MKRRILKLAAFLLLGVLLNIAVAWACAIWVAADQGSMVTYGWAADAGLPAGKHWQITSSEALGSARIVALPAGGRAADDPEPQMLFPWWSDLPRRMAARSRAARAAAQAQPDAKPSPLPKPLIADARGWPLPSLCCNWDFGTESDPTPLGESLQGGLALPARDKARAPGSFVLDFQRALPYQVIWPGFAANTILYAGACWLLVAAPLALRRRRRVKRGLCTACAYPVGTSDLCTECGKPVTPRGGSTLRVEHSESLQ